MKRLFSIVTALTVGAIFCASSRAEPDEKAAAQKSEAASLEALTKRIDEQNTKIDALTQHILKLEQEVSENHAPIMVGEPTPVASAVPQVPVAVAAASGTTHTVARGETLTAIAKMYKVSVEELQKLNHIENDRKLQIGQTLTIPSAAGPAPSATAKKPNE